MPWVQIAEGIEQPTTSGLGIIIHVSVAGGDELRLAVRDGTLQFIEEGVLNESDSAVFTVENGTVRTVVVIPTDIEALVFAELQTCTNTDAGKDCVFVADEVHVVRIPSSNRDDVDAGTPMPDAPMPDAPMPDAPMPDAQTPDAQMPDAQTSDAQVAAFGQEDR